jgi:hypothetical protein
MPNLGQQLVSQYIRPPPMPASWAVGYDNGEQQPEIARVAKVALAAPDLVAPSSPVIVDAEEEVPMGQATPPPRNPSAAAATPELSDLKVIMEDIAKGSGINNEQTEKLSHLLSVHGQAAMMGLEKGLGDTVMQTNNQTNALLDASLSSGEQHMRDAASQGTFKIRDAVGQMFSRAPDGGKMNEYKDLKSQSEKRDFRDAWVKASWAKVVTRKQFVKSWSKVDETKGTYMCFEKVMEEEGGNLRAAMLYTQKCLKMQKPWCIWNGMTERVDFLYIRKSSLETFNQCWTFFEDEHPAVDDQCLPPAAGSTAAPAVEAGKEASSGGNSGGSASSGGTAVGSGDKPGIAAPAAEKRAGQPLAETPKGKRDKKDSKPATTGGSPAEKQAGNTKAELQRLMGESGKVKVKYLANMGAATTLLQTISSDPKWKWANNSDMTKDLMEAQASLKGLDDDFSRMFLSEDSKKVRRAFSDEALVVNLDRFKVNFSKAVGDLEFETQQLVRMHSGRAGKK